MSKKLQAYIPKKLYEEFISKVMEKAKNKGQMKGVLSECVAEAIELWIKKKEN